MTTRLGLRRRGTTGPVPARRLRFLRRGRRDERGYVLAVSAIIMVPLLAISGMATDIGGWYAEGSQMQKAADAAALAGVVWLPDLSRATTVALATAKQNGFDDADSNITIVVSQISATDLRVQITDNDAPIFFSKFFMSSMTISRESVGTYVLPVPLGSPRNYFGTGNLVASGPDGMWASINGWCAPKEQGDPFAVGWMGNWTGSSPSCPGTTANDQYIPNTANQYEYIIEVPTTRVLPILVSLYSPARTNSSPDTNSGDMTTIFTMRSPDSTPFDDTDNPLTSCTGTGQSNPRSYASGEVDNDNTYFGASGWSAFCTISAAMPGGKYVLGVKSLQGETGSSTVSNNYSILASYSGLGTTCDGRTDATCPKVYGKNWISVYAAATSSAAEFFLSEIGAEHAGKQMEITLFDPGEGGNYIQIKDPNGNPVTFDYRTLDGTYSGTNLTQLDVSGCSGWPQVGAGRASQCRFNERFVVLTVDLPANYATLYPGQKWWKIYYNFSASVTDRSTWSVRIIGDPVHLSN